ncbi:MAG: hypothetical protein OEW00_03230 [candidate division Zixibacteria bacterium]|nr:hypothetical protein [candidate division Zixibacteria bacterium]
MVIDRKTGERLATGLIVAAFLMTLAASCGDGSTDSSKPDRILAVNGLYYKAVMGASETDQPITFKLTDKSNNAYADRWLRFSLMEGDGTLAADSVKTDSKGEATAQYSFDGSLGHAVIRAGYAGITPVDVTVRASTIIPGAAGQGQYILFSDTYKEVQAFNGSPESVDPDPRFWLNYAVYEGALGVVVMVEDEDSSATISDGEGVIGVIVNTVYEGKTADSIGIGSTIADLRAVYGPPDTVRPDPSPPPAIFIRYLALGMTCYGAFSADTTLFEIHVIEDIISPVAVRRARPSQSPDGSQATHTFRRPEP